MDQVDFTAGRRLVFSKSVQVVLGSSGVDVANCSEWLAGLLTT